MFDNNLKFAYVKNNSKDFTSKDTIQIRNLDSIQSMKMALNPSIPSKKLERDSRDWRGFFINHYLNFHDSQNEAKVLQALRRCDAEGSTLWCALRIGFESDNPEDFNLLNDEVLKALDQRFFAKIIIDFFKDEISTNKPTVFHSEMLSHLNLLQLQARISMILSLDAETINKYVKNSQESTAGKDSLYLIYPLKMSISKFFNSVLTNINFTNFDSLAKLDSIKMDSMLHIPPINKKLRATLLTFANKDDTSFDANKLIIDCKNLDLSSKHVSTSSANKVETPLDYLEVKLRGVAESIEANQTQAKENSVADQNDEQVSSKTWFQHKPSNPEDINLTPHKTIKQIKIDKNSKWPAGKYRGQLMHPEDQKLYRFMLIAFAEQNSKKEQNSQQDIDENIKREDELFDKLMHEDQTPNQNKTQQAPKNPTSLLGGIANFFNPQLEKTAEEKKEEEKKKNSYGPNDMFDL